MSRSAVFLTSVGSVVAGGCVAVAFFMLGGASGLVTLLSVTAGFCVGIAWEDAWKLYKSEDNSSNRKEDTTVSETHVETAAEKTSRRRFNGISTLAVLLIIVAAALGVCAVALLVTRQQVVDTQTRLTHYTKCTADWQRQFAEGYTARYKASVSVSDAMDDIVTGVADQNRPEFNAAVGRYVALRQKQLDEQTANPLPPLPDVLCGAP